MVSARAYHAAYQVSVTGELIPLSWHSECLVMSINRVAWFSCGPATVHNRCNPRQARGAALLRHASPQRDERRCVEDERLRQDDVDLEVVSGARDI